MKSMLAALGMCFRGMRAHTVVTVKVRKPGRSFSRPAYSSTTFNKDLAPWFGAKALSCTKLLFGARQSTAEGVERIV